MQRGVMVLIRFAAVLTVLTLGLGPMGFSPLRADYGGCSESSQKGCLTTNAAYPEKACTGGEGEDCITCFREVGAVCTWAGGAEDLPDYWDAGTH